MYDGDGHGKAGRDRRVHKLGSRRHTDGVGKQVVRSSGLQVWGWCGISGKPNQTAWVEGEIQDTGDWTKAAVASDAGRQLNHTRSNEARRRGASLAGLGISVAPVVLQMRKMWLTRKGTERDGEISACMRAGVVANQASG